MSDPVAVLEHELVAAAERRRASSARSRVLLAAAAVSSAAAVVVVLVSTPWSSTSFLEQAKAALTPPAGTIQHQRWEVTTTSTEYGCTVRHRPSEIWIDQRPPHRYRILLTLPAPEAAKGGPRAFACWNGPPRELGGALDGGETLVFVAPNTLRGEPRTFGFPLDLVQGFRNAISAGSAHVEGRTTFDGRTVERIRVDPPSMPACPRCPREPFYWYVDPTTYYPVGMEGPGGITSPGRPFVPLRVVVRYEAYEYLPRTEANLALTSIRAQHPDAKVR